MLSTKEEAFIQFWESNRLKQASWRHQLLTGLPMPLLLGLVFWLIIKLFFWFNWFGRGEMVYNKNGGSFMVIILISIVVFGVFFSVFKKKYQWEQKEETYQTLLKKKTK